MKIKSQSFSRIAITTVSAAAVFLAVFLSVSRADAQSIGQFPSPHVACQYFYNTPDVTVVRDLEHDCLVRSGTGLPGANIYLYTHFYDTGSNYCMEIKGPSDMGMNIAPQCMPISQTGRAAQQQQSNPGKIVTPPSFQLKELQYDTLPHGKPIKTGDNEQIEITMPDGSLIQLDANATFTPVSDYEVQSVFGRYRYMWTPFHDGKCIVGQNLARQACRKVKTRDAVLGVTGTEFLVDTDKAGTTVTVLEGLLTVADLGGKKTIEVPGGQSTYIKHGGLPSAPATFDPAKIDHWWKQNTAGSSIGWPPLMIVYVILIVFIIALIIYSSVKKKKLALAAADAAKSSPVQPKLSTPAKLVLAIIAVYVLYRYRYEIMYLLSSIL